MVTAKSASSHSEEALRRAFRFLSAEQVVAIHDALLEAWGGAEGGGHRGAAFEGVDAAVQAVKNSYYDAPEELAAAYAVYIVQGHVFLDGNKRAGSGSMLVFLDACGIKLRFDPADLAARMIDLQIEAEAGASTASQISSLARWIRERRARRGTSGPTKRRR